MNKIALIKLTLVISLLFNFLPASNPVASQNKGSIVKKEAKPISKTKKKSLGYSTAGKWCYEPVPGNSKFNMHFQFSRSSGASSVTISFGSGGATTSGLTESSPGIFIINDSPSGDKLVLDKRTGNSGVYDSTGFVGTAYRKSKNSCFQ